MAANKNFNFSQKEQQKNELSQEEKMQLDILADIIMNLIPKDHFNSMNNNSNINKSHDKRN